jgi:hypothetical protein
MVRGWQHRLASMPRHAWANVHLDASAGTVVPRIVGVVWGGGSAHTQAQAMIDAVGVAPASISYANHSHAGAISALAGSRGTQRQSWVAGSDVIAEPLSTAKVTAAVELVRKRGAGGHAGTLLLDPLDGAVHSGSTKTSCFPWRSDLASLQWYVGLSTHASSATVSSGRAFIAAGHKALAKSSVGGYVNYPESARPVRSYYGSNWARLLEINRKYDPDGVFSAATSLPG